MSFLAALAAISMSTAITRFCEFVIATLSAIEIVLIATVLLWHFRTRIDGSDSKEPT
jgi:hypothetical protein